MLFQSCILRSGFSCQILGCLYTCLSLNMRRESSPCGPLYSSRGVGHARPVLMGSFLLRFLEGSILPSDLHWLVKEMDAYQLYTARHFTDLQSSSSRYPPPGPPEARLEGFQFTHLVLRQCRRSAGIIPPLVNLDSSPLSFLPHPPWPADENGSPL